MMPKNVRKNGRRRSREESDAMDSSRRDVSYTSRGRVLSPGFISSNHPPRPTIAAGMYLIAPEPPLIPAMHQGHPGACAHLGPRPPALPGERFSSERTRRISASRSCVSRRPPRPRCVASYQEEICIGAVR